jgi:hypothetical protein
MLISALLAGVSLACAVTGSSARNLAMSNQTFRSTWAPISFTEPSGFAVIRCHLTLEGSFHSRTIPKVARLLIGNITRVAVNQSTCREDIFGSPARLIPWNGVETSLGTTIGQSLPWHLTYEGFTGTLPNIVGITVLLSGVKFNLEVPLTSCLATYGGSTTNWKRTINLSSGVATTVTPGRETITRSALIRGECPMSLGFANNGTITLLNSTTRITITLI